MRLLQQKKILDLLDTFEAANKMGVYKDCRDGALHVIKYITGITAQCDNTISLLEKYMKLLDEAGPSNEKELALHDHLTLIRNSVKVELKPDKYKAVFLPYYDNTWDSMKSVYTAFSHDPLFETEVVIIPILRNTNEGLKFVWEDYLTPAGILNTHYQNYSFADDIPDFVFYNQPYDGVNIPEFQSQNIRKYAAYMIFIPYYMVPVDVQGEIYENNYTEMDSIRRCDLYIAQSESFRQFYMKGMPIYNKALPVGHPKCDCLYLAKEYSEYIRYTEWEEKIGNRCVILLNTHYSSMLEGVQIDPGICHLIDYVAKHDDLFLIWRPHPLAFLMRMSAEMQAKLRFVENHFRMILDRTPYITTAYMYMDALVSLFPSSVIMDALFLDLPVFLLGQQRKSRDQLTEEGIAFYDAIFHEDYLLTPPEEMMDDESKRGYKENSVIKQLDTFLIELQSREDSKREGRNAYRLRAFPNTDGTVAEKVLTHIKTLIFDER